MSSPTDQVTLLKLGYAASFAFGLVVTFCLAMCCKWILNKSVQIELKPPWGIPGKPWQGAVRFDLVDESKKQKIRTGVQELGMLEAIFFYICISIDAGVLIVAWLAFKGVTKWAAWQHIIKVPDQLVSKSALDQLSLLEARNRWGTLLHQRFLIGTIYNLVAALFGLGAGFLVREAVKHFVTINF